MPQPLQSEPAKVPSRRSPSGDHAIAEHPLDRNKSVDIGAELFAEIDQYSPDELEAESAIVRRMLDRRILPMICITYTIQFLDKLSLNYASAYSLIPDLGLEGQRYSWTAAIFNFGYLFWAIPANLLIQKLPVAKYTGSMILIWAVVLIAHIGARNYAGILVLRFLLGMFEASISPAIMNICSMFYTRSEQPLRMCIFLSFNGMATSKLASSPSLGSVADHLPIVIGALLGYGLGHSHSASLKSWQLIFLTIGLINFVWAWVFLWLVPDSPSAAKFLSHKQRIVAIKRVSDNMIGVKNKKLKTDQVFEALLDIKVMAIAFIGLGCGVVNGGVSNFASSLIKGFGFSGINATLLQLPLGAFEFALVPLCGLIATYIRDTRCLVLAGICLLPFATLLGIRFTPQERRWTLVGCSWLQYLVGAPVILSWNLLTTNIAGHTKRSIANGMWFVFYAGGNVAGANIFFAREAPRYFSAITGLLICYAGMIVLSLCLRLHMQRENRRRDNLIGNGDRTKDGADTQAVLDGFRDMTDKQNVHFRYAL